MLQSKALETQQYELLQSHEDLYSESDDIESPEVNNVDDEGIPPEPASTKEHASSRGRFLTWVTINCISTISIVFTNKRLLTDPNFKHCQALFVAYHFCLTSTALYCISHPLVGWFKRESASLKDIVPLAVLLSLNTAFTNLTLTYLEVSTYQQIRILLTPFIVAINFLAYRKCVSWISLLALLFACGGIALTIRSEMSKKAMPETSSVPGSLLFGYTCGLISVSFSAIYTVRLAHSLAHLKITVLQLMYLLSPMSCILLLLIAPLSDSLPVWSAVSSTNWGLLALSGGFAVLINISVVFIVSSSSALTSTVVGQAKTIMIILMAWSMSRDHMLFNTVVGILLTVIGIVAYSLSELYLT